MSIEERKAAFQRARETADRQQAERQAHYDWLHKMHVADMASRIFASCIVSGKYIWSAEDAVQTAEKIVRAAGVKEPFQVPRTHDDDLKPKWALAD